MSRTRKNTQPVNTLPGLWERKAKGLRSAALTATGGLQHAQQMATRADQLDECAADLRATLRKTAGK